jgi:hypothetical protein
MQVDKSAGEWKGSFNMDATTLASGIYLVRATASGTEDVQRILLQH